MRLQNLGYAVTSYRAQGITVDSSHVLADASMTRENFYVAMTRGKEANIAYVTIDKPDPAHDGPHPGDNEEATARSVLFGVLRHVGAELSAHETIAAEQDAWGSIAQLAAEYETLAGTAQHDRWATLIRASGLTDDQTDEAIASPVFGALTAELRRAEANQHNVDTLMPRLVAARGFGDTDDIAAVLHHRLARATARPAASGRTRKAPQMVAGLIPEATGPMSAYMRKALTERRDLIQKRTDAILDQAVTEGQSWVLALGETPGDARAAATWRQHAQTVAAYRDRYGITTKTPLGPAPDSDAQKIDTARAKSALAGLRDLTPVHSGAKTSRPAGRESAGRSR